MSREESDKFGDVKPGSIAWMPQSEIPPDQFKTIGPTAITYPLRRVAEKLGLDLEPKGKADGDR